MKLIAHRGNVYGPNLERENTQSYIEEALAAGYDVEVDVWYNTQNGEFYLGHDNPIEPIQVEFLRKTQLWCHAKDITALASLLQIGAHCFIHEKDPATLTSHGKIWTYPGKRLMPDAICVLPEMFYDGNLKDCYGICSDYVNKYEYLNKEK